MSPLPVAYSNTRVSTEYIHPCNRGGQLFFRFPRLTGTPFVPLIGLPASSDLLSDCFDSKAAVYRDHLYYAQVKVSTVNPSVPPGFPL